MTPFDRPDVVPPDEWADEWERDAVPGQDYCERCDCYHDGTEGCPFEWDEGRC